MPTAGPTPRWARGASMRLEPELQPELDLVVLGQDARRELARQARETRVLEAQAERRRHVGAQAEAFPLAKMLQGGMPR